MHIVYLTSEFPTPGLPHGGVGTFVKAMATKLVKKGEAVTVVGFYKNTSADEVMSVEEGISVVRLRPSRWKFFRFIDHALRINQALKNIHEKNKIDVVESAELGLAFINKIKGIKYVIRMHGGHHFFAQAEKRKISAWRGFQEKRSFAKADALVGVSQYVVEHTSTYLEFDPKKVPVIFNPVDAENFQRADPSKMVAGRIVFVGTVCEKKGIRQLVQAMPQICQAHPQAHLMVAGRDWFFPSGLSYQKYLQDFIDPLVKDKITFLGSIAHAEIPALLESAEVCVYPSHMEALPLAWLEGLAMGKAVVASKTGPGPEVVEDGVTGLLCDPYSPDDIASSINKILSDPSLNSRLAANAFQSVRTIFDMEKIVAQNISFYSNLR